MGISVTADIIVELQGQYGTDLDICRSAWVSSGNDRADATEDEQRRLIRALMREKHGSPFEDGFFKFWIRAPVAVRNEHVRHRIGSYSSASARYRVQEPLFYLPPPHRPLRKVVGSKQIQPKYEPYSQQEWRQFVDHLVRGYQATWERVEAMQADGFTETEALRWLNCDALVMPYIYRCNPRSLMHFLSLRTHEKEANHTSYPLWEIEQVARQMEEQFAIHLPLTYASWVKFGRESP